MNAIADWLFSFFLGWTGTLFNGALRSFSSNSSGITSLFSVIWLPLLLVLILVGTAGDFIIWFVRWRPHYLWRSNVMRRLAKKQQPPAAASGPHEMPADYRRQIAQWVEEEPPVTGLWEDAPLPYGEMQPAPQEGYAAALEPEPLPYDEALYAPPLLQQEEGLYPLLPLSGAGGDAAYGAVPYLAEDEPLFTPQMQGFYDSLEEAALPAPAQPAAQDGGRRRRSARHAKTAGGAERHPLGGLLRSLAPDDQEVLEGLPPPVSREEAFREPVYPPSYPHGGKDEP